MQWDRWQKIHGGNLSTSLESVLRGFPAKPKVEDVIDIKKLGYIYKHPEGSLKGPIPIVAAGLTPRDVKLKSTLAQADQMVALWGGAGPFTFELKVPEKFHRAELWLEGVRVSRDISYQLEAFVHPPDVKIENEKDPSKYSMGVFSMWRGHAGKHSSTHIARSHMFLPITNKLGPLSKGNEGKAWRLTLVAKPVDSDNPEHVPDLREEIRFESVHLLLDNANPLRDAKEKKHGK
jgi:hypothetical protein